MTLPPMAKYLAAAGVLGLALFFAVSFSGNDQESDQPNPQLADADSGSSRIPISAAPVANVFPAGPAAAIRARELAASNDDAANLDSGDDSLDASLADVEEAGQSLADLQEPEQLQRQERQPIPLLAGESVGVEEEQLLSEGVEQADQSLEFVSVEPVPTEAQPIPILAQAASTEALTTAPIPALVEQVQALEQIVESKPVLKEGAEPEAYADRILAYQAQNYTLQLLGSYSETSAQKFIEESTESDGYAYFETRFQDRPWFVVVYGSFADRSAATAAIASLPAAQRALEPWVRSLGGIQEDIRKYWVRAN